MKELDRNRLLEHGWKFIGRDQLGVTSMYVNKWQHPEHGIRIQKFALISVRKAIKKARQAKQQESSIVENLTQMMRMTKYEMAERIATQLQGSDRAIPGISAATLTVALTHLRLDEVKRLYAHNVDPNYIPAWGVTKG